MSDDLTPADLAHRIEDADRVSKPAEQRLRFQWNVPEGVTPHIPFWFAMGFLGLIVVAVLLGVLGH